MGLVLQLLPGAAPPSSRKQLTHDKSRRFDPCGVTDGAVTRACPNSQVVVVTITKFQIILIDHAEVFWVLMFG